MNCMATLLFLEELACSCLISLGYEQFDDLTTELNKMNSTKFTAFYRTHTNSVRSVKRSKLFL
jgi:hypothetical protein